MTLCHPIAWPTQLIQTINNGMSLESLAALLGHHSLIVTLMHARIADQTLQNEYLEATQ
jgi:site-specific recombinase XerD